MSICQENSKEKAMYLLHKMGVTCVSGSAFYHECGGEQSVRFYFAKKKKRMNPIKLVSDIKIYMKEGFSQ